MRKWENKRTEESREVENSLRRAGFQQVDAYRYNSASLRIRIIDSKFEGLDAEDRDAMVEKELDKLPENTQGDIVFLLTLAPTDLESDEALGRRMLNHEFEHPSRSEL